MQSILLHFIRERNFPGTRSLSGSIMRIFIVLYCTSASHDSNIIVMQQQLTVQNIKHAAPMQFVDHQNYGTSLRPIYSTAL